METDNRARRMKFNVSEEWLRLSVDTGATDRARQPRTVLAKNCLGQVAFAITELNMPRVSGRVIEIEISSRSHRWFLLRAKRALFATSNRQN